MAQRKRVPTDVELGWLEAVLSQETISKKKMILLAMYSVVNKLYISIHNPAPSPNSQTYVNVTNPLYYRV